MGIAVIAVGTANRPEILNRCITAAVAGCSVARHAHWIVLDDSAPAALAVNRDIVRQWRSAGLRVTYVDATVEAEISDALPDSSCRSFFAHLVARPSSCRAPGGRNLALLTGLSFDPDVLFFVDDDIVHHHEGNCFFHWCANNGAVGGSFVAAPRKLGIPDMSYLNRLLTVLSRTDWFRFLRSCDISADPESWYSSDNPLWKRRDDGDDDTRATPSAREVVSGQFVALRNRDGVWLPFPGGYNEDVNWSILQSAFYGTPLVRIRGVNARHLPPGLGHPTPEAIASQIVGAAITRALREVKGSGDELMTTLTDRFLEALGSALRLELFSLLQLDRSIHLHARECVDDDAVETLRRIESTLFEANQWLKAVNTGELGRDWLRDVDDRRQMFGALRRNETVQARIRGVLLKASADR